ncbi:MAG: hypothetical protein ABI693_17555 [Bryobacteraceae bacterium]
MKVEVCEEEYRRFQAELVVNPAIGAVLRGGSGEVSNLTPKQIALLAKVVKEEFGNESENV